VIVAQSNVIPREPHALILHPAVIDQMKLKESDFYLK
tara:strand:+ start:1468 stop:1578 length:111 start_codon:yes stop_codon:yes gene_type:complete